MDKAKRQTLVRAGHIGLATMAGIALTHAGYSNATSADLNDGHNTSDNLISLSDIKVYTRISALNNDVEVVVSNTGKETARITQMTPSQTSTARGTFHFSTLMKDGPLTLAPGESVSVQMTPHAATVKTAMSPVMNARSLTQSLRASFSVITDNNAFAMVDVVEGVRFS